MKKRVFKKRKVKNFILRAITFVAVVFLITSGFSIDSGKIGLLFLINTISLLWLSLFAYANGYMK